MARGVWTYVGGRAGNKPSPAEKAAITATCERLIAEVLQPRFLPELRPSATGSYPAAIEASGTATSTGSSRATARMIPLPPAAEFDAPFARLDYVSRDCLDLLWRRHTGEWHRVAEGLSLAEALHRIASEPYFRPC